MRFFARCLLLLTGCLIAAAPSLAQESSGGRLQVLRPVIDAQQEQAQICLEFDHPLDLADRGRLAADVHLTEDGKPAANLANDITAAGNFLCVQQLAHRHSYGLTAVNLRGAGGESLAGPYSLSFAVPDRRPSIAFEGDPDRDSLMHYGAGDPVLRAVNIPRVRIELYRLTDAAAMAEAYDQRLQTALAPSESLTFARTHGKLIWQGEMALGAGGADDANRTIEQPVPLRAAIGGLPSGLYFIAARAQAPAEKSKTGAAALPPMAAQWFLRSDLRLRAIAAGDGFYAETENAAGDKLLPDVRLALIDGDRQTIAEGKSDASGVAFLSLPAGKHAAVMSGETASGDIDFADLTQISPGAFALPGLAPVIAADRPFYAPGAMVHLTLAARDVHGEAVAVPDSRLQLLRPDGGFYADLPVPGLQAGLASMAFPAPAAQGLWSLVWQRKDQSELARARLRITANEKAPRLEITADRAALGEGGNVAVTLKSVAADGEPAPFIAGHLMLHWDRPATLAGWPGYLFGTDSGDHAAPVSVAAFLTGKDGMAVLHLTLHAPAQSAAVPRRAALEALADPATGALDPDPLYLPVPPAGSIVGLKPLSPDGKFAENGIARFDVVALGAGGKRENRSGLSYQVYEEGRNFTWYQSDGHWTYKPLAQRRRIAGGALAIRAQGTTLSWPVTAGAYTVEITGASGALLARAPAQAGWNPAPQAFGARTPLQLQPGAPVAQPKTPMTIAFRLGRPAIVSAVIADDRIRKVLQESLPAGADSIAFVPGESWGDRIAVDVRAQGAGERAEGRIELPVSHDPKKLIVTAAPPPQAAPGQDLALPFTIANAADPRGTYISALAVPEADNRDGAPEPESVAVEGTPVSPDGKEVLHMTVPEFSGRLHIRIFAVNRDQQGVAELTIPVHPAFAATLTPPSLMRTGDRARLTLKLADYGAPAGAYHYEAVAAPGLGLIGNVKGAEEMTPGRTKKFALEAEARAEGAHEIRLDIDGPHGLRVARGWMAPVIDPGRAFSADAAATLAPAQSWAPPKAAKNEKRKTEKPALLFISAYPLPALPELLRNLTQAEPFATGAMAAWLEAARLWRGTIAQAGLWPSPALDARRREILLRLMQRQNADGSFPAQATGGRDMTATAEALAALAEADQPLTRPAAARAAGWLGGQLQNSWFDEKERPARAAAFAAMAAADRLNLSTLRYFAETSAGKNLPPLAMAQLSLALVKSNDMDKAGGWLKEAQAEAGKAGENSPALLLALAQNPLLDAQALPPLLQKAAASLTPEGARDPLALARLLRAYGALAARAGSFRAIVNGSDKTAQGVLVAALPEKTSGFAVRNTTDRPLFVLPAEMADRPFAGTAIRRRFFRPDGAEIMDARLERGGIYIMVLEGPWPSGNGKPIAELLVHDAPALGLVNAGCALDPAIGAADGWSWLGKLSLNRADACFAETHGLDVMLKPAGGVWRIAYPVRAVTSGLFGPGPTALRTASGNLWIAAETLPREIDIR